MNTFELLSTSALHTVFKKRDIHRRYSIEMRGQFDFGYEVIVSTDGDHFTIYLHNDGRVIDDCGRNWTDVELEVVRYVKI